MPGDQDLTQSSNKSVHEVDETLYDDDQEKFSDHTEFDIDDTKSINSIKSAVKFTQDVMG